MIQYAHINENSRVLEPSAGIGNIADQIKKTTNNLDVVEYMNHFSELLRLKGHNVVGNDFLEYETDDKYDAIIMNPPFSDEQNHIKHAYDLLKNDGILVSISSPHWTFANDKNSVEFRQWLENETYFTEDLKSGTFEMTGVASKIIVIKKHIQVETKTA
jgi:type I restriction-modification system DNA methylase subunit